jgi:hypothetical protein
MARRRKGASAEKVVGIVGTIILAVFFIAVLVTNKQYVNGQVQ